MIDMVAFAKKLFTPPVEGRMCGWCHLPDHPKGEHCSRCQAMGSKGLLKCDCGAESSDTE